MKSFLTILDELRAEAREYIISAASQHIDLRGEGMPIFIRQGREIPVVWVYKNEAGVLVITDGLTEGRLADMETEQLLYLADILRDYVKTT